MTRMSWYREVLPVFLMCNELCASDLVDETPEAVGAYVLQSVINAAFPAEAAAEEALCEVLARLEEHMDMQGKHPGFCLIG